MKKFYYERSNLLESEVNVNFEDVLWMSMEDTIAWIDKLREFILDEWDNKGTPPTIGLNADDIIDNFKKLREYPLHQGRKQFLVSDDDGNRNIIKNYNKQA